MPRYRAVAEGLIAWVGEVLSDPARGGFFASQDADQTLDDDGDYFTWTLAELRAVLDPARGARRWSCTTTCCPRGEMHHNSEKNVLWIAETPEGIAGKLNLREDEVALLIARAKEKMLAARRLRRPTPAVDDTLYVAWNSMFVSAYLEAARVLGRPDCRAFALKTLDRILAEAWDPAKGFLHRVGGPRLEGSLDDQVFAIAALLDAWEATLDPRYFEIAERAAKLCIERLRRSRRRRIFRPRQRRRAHGRPRSSPQAAAGFAHAGGKFRRGDRARPALRVHRRKALSRVGGKNARGFRGIDSAVRNLCRHLRARRAAARAPSAAGGDHRRGGRCEGRGAGKRRASACIASEKPCCASRRSGWLPARCPRLCAETLPHLDAAVPQAFVCVETTCYPPVTEPEKLLALLAEAPKNLAAKN